MNKERRAELAAISAELDNLKGSVDELRQRVEAVKDEEQEYYDNMPEGFQNAERGENAQAAIDALDTAISELEGFDFDNVINSLDEASGQ